MVTDSNTQKFKTHLENLRQILVDKRRALEQATQDLLEKQIEFEEKATNEQIAGELEHLEDQGEWKIAAIDHALDRIHDGDYLICESCESPISIKRLEAVPWTTLCIDCARKKERRPGEEPMELETTEENLDLPSELRGLSDEQLVGLVIDALRRDSEIPVEDVTVTCRRGLLRLEGVLPDTRQHSRLQQIVYDIIGFEDVQDWIKIDRTAWERRDRTPGISCPKEEDPGSVEGGGIASIEAIKEGKTIDPADEIIPEKRGGPKKG